MWREKRSKRGKEREINSKRGKEREMNKRQRQRNEKNMIETQIQISVFCQGSIYGNTKT